MVERIAFYALYKSRADDAFLFIGLYLFIVK